MKLSKKIWLWLAAAMAIPAGMSAQEQILAFPGAEGFGKYTLGARAVANPEVYHVTNLNDSGAGSLRDAVSQSGRIVVFDVCGTINLKSTLIFKGNNTILGQTAPGEGIQVYGNRVSFSGASNLIVRHMRFRMGTNGDSGKDAAGIANGHDMIFDHLSVLWGRDENFSINPDGKGDIYNITIQNSIIGQGLQSHSCGGLLQTDGGVTIYRNLYIENKTRNPKVKGLNQYVNNVVYNWGNGGCYIMGETESASWAHIENNYFMRGPWKSAAAPFIRGTEAFHIYAAGNYYDDNLDGVLNGKLMPIDDCRGWLRNRPVIINGQETTVDWGSTPVESLDALNKTVIHEVIHGTTDGKMDYDIIKSENYRSIPRPIPAIDNMMTAEESYKWMIDNVGPVLPARDEVDKYIIDELTSYGIIGTENGISAESQLPHKGTGVLSGGVKPLDTDGDGIPDEWEIKNGLNPNDASDAVAIAANGYTNIENFANGITEAFPYIKKPVKFALTGDPTKTSGTFTWDINDNSKHGFIIELSNDGTTFTEVANVPAGNSSYEIKGLTEKTPYWVRMRSTDGNGLFSDYSDTVKFETIGDPAAPAPSTNPFPASGSRSGVAAGLTLTWENNIKTYGGDVTYTVMFGESAESLSQVATGISKTEWDASSTVEVGKTYYWRVDATNTIGTTSSDVWNFTTTAGGVLFYTDFTTTPAKYAKEYGNLAANTNIINAANTSKDFDGMIIGSGATSLRIIAMPGCYSSDSSKDYGPATEEDAGATSNCVQFKTTSAGGYITTPEVTGPCVVTIWVGNPDGKSSKTAKLHTIINDNEAEVESFAVGNKKRIYKFTYNHTLAGPVKFKFDANGKYLDVNDILVERWVPEDPNKPIEVTAGSLDNTNLSYADGSLSLTFNQEVTYNGGAEIKGITQWETISPVATGKKLTISYEALNVNTDYSITFPEGTLTDLTGEKSYTGTIKMSTADFGPAKQSGETHYGKQAKTLPLTFAPFNAVAPFETTGGIVQTSQNDYPHWVQVSGGKSADHASMTSTSDKIMTLFDGESKLLALDIEYIGTGNPRLKLQESRNCDVTPGWRTMRVLEKGDFPFKGEIAVNPETRMVKLAPVTIGGELKVNAMRLSDANGYFGDDYQSGITDINALQAMVIATSGSIRVTGVTAETAVSVYDVAGRIVAAGRGESAYSLAPGMYIVSIQNGPTVKVIL